MVIFYSHEGDAASPGNYGMYDQVMALEWVQENIAGKILWESGKICCCFF